MYTTIGGCENNGITTALLAMGSSAGNFSPDLESTFVLRTMGNDHTAEASKTAVNVKLRKGLRDVHDNQKEPVGDSALRPRGESTHQMLTTVESLPCWPWEDYPVAIS